MCLDQVDIFKIQLRASTYGKVGVMMETPAALLGMGLDELSMSLPVHIKF
nr:hypothetical protein [Abyssisolibacter fermentans]